jgi:hypothetical protein
MWDLPEIHYRGTTCTLQRPILMKLDEHLKREAVKGSTDVLDIGMNREILQEHKNK